MGALLGIGDVIASAFGAGDLLASLGGIFGFGDAAAAGAGAAGLADLGVETGLATVGGVEGAAAGAGGLADIVGTGTGLFGGATGLEGTLLAGGATGGIESVLGAGAGGALGALGTAESFLGAPGASAFNPAAIGGVNAFSSAPGTALGSANLPANVANANAAVPGGSVFNTGTAPITGVSASGAPSAIPAGGGASAVAGPAGLTTPADVTSLASGATGATPGAGAGAITQAPSTIDSLLGKVSGGIMDSLTKNPLGVALGAGGLGYNILEGQKQTANQKALSADAARATANSNQLTASGEALQQYLASGTLPPQYMTQVDQAIKDAKTAAISNAASQGQSTDPNQNTALATTLAKIDQQKPGMISNIASQLFTSGSSLVSAGQGAAGLSGQLYQALVQNDTTQAVNTGKAIAALAAALNGKAQASAGGTGGTTITLG